MTWGSRIRSGRPIRAARLGQRNSISSATISVL